MRKRKDKDVPEVAVKKRGQKLHPETNKPACALRPSPPEPKHWGVINFLPKRPLTENDVSILKAKQWLQCESVKRRQDLQGIRLRMELTFADRRKDIISEKASIHELKNSYPCLFTEEEVINEFQRLTEINLDKQFLTGLTTYGHRIFDKAQSTNQEKEKILAALAATGIQAEKNRLIGYGCLLLLPSILKECLQDILCEEGSKPDIVTSPLLVYKGDHLGQESRTETEYTLFADNEAIAQPLDLIQGFECLLAVYYIFNLAYPPTVNNSLTFLLKIIVGLSDEAPMPRKVTSLLTKLSQKDK